MQCFTGKRKKVLIICSALVLLCSFFMFCFEDLQSITIWSTNIWDTLADSGNIRNYYSYSAMNIYGVRHEYVGSDMLVYIPLAIWNLPIWAIQRWAHIDIISHPIMLLYSKCFLLLVLFGIFVLVKKIFALDGEKNKSLLCIYLIYSSLFMMLDISYAGQNDLLVIFLFLLGLLNLFKGKKWQFYLFISLSIAFKPYMFLAYLVVLLLIQKKIHLVIRDTIFGVSIYFLQKIIFIGAPMYKESLEYGPSSRMIISAIESRLSISSTGISIFVLALLAIFIMAYMTDLQKEDANFQYTVIYYIMLVLLCQAALIVDSFSRPIYMTIFLCMCIAYRTKFFRANIILETIYYGCVMVYCVFKNPNFLISKYLVWNLNSSDVASLSTRFDAIIGHNWHDVFIIVNTLAFVALLMLAIINHPKFNKESQVLTMETEWYIHYIRILVTLTPLVLVLFL